MSARLVRPSAFPGREKMVQDEVDIHVILDLGEDCRSSFSHPKSIILHDSQVCTHNLREVCLVNNEQIRLRDSGTTLAGNLVTPTDVDHVYNIVRQLARVVGREIVAATLDEQDIRTKLPMEVLERREVCGYVFPHGRVWTAAGLDGPNAWSRQGIVSSKELGVFSGVPKSSRHRSDRDVELFRRFGRAGQQTAGHLPCEYVVRDGRDRVPVSQGSTQGEHQRRLS